MTVDAEIKVVGLNIYEEWIPNSTRCRHFLSSLRAFRVG